MTSNLIGGKTRGCKTCRFTRTKPGESGFKWILNHNYRKNAEVRGLAWGLTDEEVKAIFLSPCHYCGKGADEPPLKIKQLSKGASPFIHNGMDRIDNTAGYVKGNVVACCKMCNHMKRDYSLDAFLEHVGKIHNRMAAPHIKLEAM